MLFKLFPCHCLAVIEPCVAITEVPSLFWLQATLGTADVVGTMFE